MRFHKVSVAFLFLVVSILPSISVADGKQRTHWFYDHQTNQVFVYSTSEYKHFTGIRFWDTGKQYIIRNRPEIKGKEKTFVDEYGHRREMNFYERREMEADKGKN